ncbi:MAG: hypothetical protein ACREQW_22890 [Candidatus Binatia bacterium]
MCGIVGVVGNGDIAPLLMESLGRLQYRDYDSCGLATVNEIGIDVRKDVGRLEDVAERWNFTSAQGQVGIAHTRRATHGGVSQNNAHPHLSCDQNFAVVHNGIIFNHEERKIKLQGLGKHFFFSETDSEVIGHLMEEAYQPGVSVEDAFVRVLHCLEGIFAIAMISRDEPETIFCASHKRPLMLGIDSGTNYVGSDAKAFPAYTRQIIPLNDGEYGVVLSNHFRIRAIATGEERRNPPAELDWTVEYGR